MFRCCSRLQSSSEDGLSFLEGFGLNLSSIVRLGGHSVPRTHSNPVGPNVGFYIVKGVSSRLKEAPNVEIKTNTKVKRATLAWLVPYRHMIQHGLAGCASLGHTRVVV